jgi:polyisoprenoid-binding protein YceI
MKQLLLGAVAAAFLMMPVEGALAAVEKYTFEKPHTQILFSVNHLGFSNSTGRFNDFDGQMIIDRENPANSSVNVTIKTDSIDMSHEAWEDHLKNADFFNVEKFPEMTFESTNVEITGENTANVTGDLTILGVTKPVVLAVTHNKSGKHPMKNVDWVGFSATTTIKRSDFGMNYGLPNVSDEVDIRIEVEGEAVSTDAPKAEEKAAE